MYTWEKNKHSVGISELDEQHKMIFSIINDIYTCILLNETHKIDILLLKLIIYATKHFKTENSYILEYSMKAEPNVKKTIEEHLLEHENFLSVVVSKIEDHVFNNKVILIDIALFLNIWINNHVINDDVVLFEMFSK